VLEAGRAEEQHIATRHALDDATVGSLMTRGPITLDPRQSLADVAEQVQGTARHTAYPVVAGDTLIGLLPLHALATTPHAEWRLHTVGERMIPAEAVPQFTPETTAADAVELLAGGSIGRGVVLRRGRVVGILSLSDVARAVAAGWPV
jgi:CBS domain-containing protein